MNSLPPILPHAAVQITQPYLIAWQHDVLSRNHLRGEKRPDNVWTQQAETISTDAEEKHPTVAQIYTYRVEIQRIKKEVMGIQSHTCEMKLMEMIMRKRQKEINIISTESRHDDRRDKNSGFWDKKSELWDKSDQTDDKGRQAKKKLKWQNKAVEKVKIMEK